MIESYDKRTALLPLHYGSRQLSVNGEFIVDYNYGRFFYNKNGIITEISRDELVNMVNTSIEEIVEIDPTSIDFDKLIENITEVNEWIHAHTTPSANRITSINQLINFIDGMKPLNFTIRDVMDNKVTLKPNKMLSDNNFSDAQLNKLNTISYGAETYNHPSEFVCNINRGVYSINGYPGPNIYGNINLSISDIGLGNLDPEANYYEHPDEIVCNAKMIKSFNGESGDVEITKESLGLSNIKNMRLSGDKSYLSDNEYATPAIVENYLSKIATERNMKATNIYYSGNTKVIIKDTAHGQINTAEYISSGDEVIVEKIDIHIEQIIMNDDEILILSDNKLLIYEFINGDLTSSTIDIDDMYTIKSIISPYDNVYGVVVTDGTDDKVILYGDIEWESESYTHISKVEISNNIVYILLESGVVKYIELLDAMINDSYREIILSYNDIIDIYVMSDYMIVMLGNRELVVAGEDTTLNHSIPSKIKSYQNMVYKMEVYDDIICMFNIDETITLLGRKINALEGMKFKYPIEEISINKSSVVMIDRKNNIIEV